MRTSLVFPLIILGCCLCSCSHRAKTFPQDVIKKYERLVQEMKADSISQLFTADAEVGHEGQPSITSRDSIYHFLSSFKNVIVVSNVDSVSTISIKDDSAVVSGIYRQTVIVSGKDTVNVAGQFTSNMVLDKNKNWMIRRMKTRSL